MTENDVNYIPSFENEKKMIKKAQKNTVYFIF